ncbi:MAG: DUF1326 domain-containing protein [Proteobacteria bacterium]|nr:DUF1326 domain-containing protein [Pseudomonadota bacterium]
MPVEGPRPSIWTRYGAGLNNGDQAYRTNSPSKGDIMAYVDWMIRGKKFGGCSCDYGCPCEFNARPTHEVCEGFEGMEIEEGHFDGVRLDGLRYGAIYRWPGPIHEGGGIVQGVIDARAIEEQRDALFKILGGEEQEPTTVFNIYGSTIEKELDPVIAPIEFACDIEGRTARMVIPNVIEASLEPIRNPVTGDLHRAIIRLPEGFEFHDGEMASSRFKGTGEIKMDRANCYGVLTSVAYGPYGIIDD